MHDTPETLNWNVEDEVIGRYADAADAPEAALCCPIDGYEPRFLEILPDEIVEKDYGCGDPSRFVQAGETVVDLGSGAGKICYILSQTVGESGRVIGVDFNDAMLRLSRKYQDTMAERIGYGNVEFVKGRIQDLDLDLEKVEAWLSENPVTDTESLLAFEGECRRLRTQEPLIPTASADVVVSNCVLNLVRPEKKPRLFRELYRVLRRGGRAIISDIVCDEEPTPAIRQDPKLWSGCIAGAFREDRFLKMFEEVGFYGIEILERHDEPWQTIDGVEFRGMTVRAYKGKEGPCLERNQAVVYTGPWKQVEDDDGHVLRRGERMAVCDKTFKIYTRPDGPYADRLIPIPPYKEVPLEEAAPFPCDGTPRRHPRETKGEDYRKTEQAQEDSCC